MCSTGPFQFRWLKGYIYSSGYYQHRNHQIGSINLTHCYHIFRGCVPEMFVASFSVTYCIYIPGILFLSSLCILWRVQITGYVLACRSYSFICTQHHLIIIIVQTYLKTFNLPISTVMIDRLYTLSYYHHQIGSMNYYPLFRVRSWNNCMLCMFLYILINTFLAWVKYNHISCVPWSKQRTM